MEAILNFFGGLFGYVLEFLYLIIPNYGITLIMFTLFTKLILFPLSIQQQKTLAVQSRMSAKQRELQIKYANDKNKYNEELMRLYEKENYNPSSGCLPMLIQFPILIGLFYAIRSPLTNVLHIAASKVTQLEALVTNPSINNYKQIAVIRDIGSIRGSIGDILTGDEISRLDNFSKGFNFFGLDLLSTPSFKSILIIIPLLCLITSVGSSVLTSLMQGKKLGVGTFIFALFLSSITTWFSFLVPAAVGLYWVFSNIFGFLQTILLNKYFNQYQMSAKAESARIQRRILEEQIQLDKAAKYPKVYVPKPVFENSSASQKSISSKNKSKKKKSR